MKVEFVTPLVLERCDNPRGTWKVYATFVAKVDGTSIMVPVGFLTDLASVPRLPLTYYLAGGRGVKAATLHDYLYHTRSPRSWADSVFYHALIAEGEPELMAKLMHDAVRAGGGAHYDEGKKLEVQVATADWPPPP